MPGLSVQYAIEQENLSLLRCLLAVPGNVPTPEIRKALTEAAARGSADCVRLLLAAFPDKDHPLDSSEKTVLHYAAEHGKVDVVKVLIEEGCDIDLRSRGRTTALHLAANRGNDDVVQELVANHASVNAQDAAGSTALILAAKNRHVSVMRTLAKAKCRIDTKDNNERSALHYSCQRAVGADCLIQHGANVNVVDSNNNTPLIVAATEGFDNVVELLSEQPQCERDIKNSTGLAAIHILAMKNHWRAVDHLADHGADVNLLDNFGRLPLWYAVNHNRHHAIKSLLKANSMTEHSEEGQGCNSLATALVKGLYGVAKLLVLAGCKLDALYPWLKTFAEEKERRLWEERNRVTLFVDDDDSDSSDSDDERMEIEEAYEWFTEWVHHPHTLQQQCRISIRRFVGQHVWHKAEELPLPRAIIDYVTLKEVEDHHLPGTLM